MQRLTNGAMSPQRFKRRRRCRSAAKAVAVAQLLGEVISHFKKKSIIVIVLGVLISKITA
jgi:hypothetical protein